MSNNEQAKIAPNVFDIFVAGARKGWVIFTNNLLPNVMMAYTLSHILKLLGIMEMVEVVFGPLMGLFGLPGGAIAVLATTWLSSSAGVGVMVGLMNQNTLNFDHVTILLPAIYLMGSQLQYMGRLLGVADVPKKYWPLLMLVSIINAGIAMQVMRFFI